MKEELLFCPLGGSGEIGMNMNLYAYGKPEDQKWIIVDIGVTFADDSLPGIDLIYPDPGFIIDKKDKLLGIILTHAHEDHIGAIAYVWPKLKCKIYATPFTAAIITEKFKEKKIDIIPFLKVVSLEVHKLLLIRFPSKTDYRKTYWSEKERLRDLYPSLKFYRGKDSMIQQLQGCRICIHDYFGTTWLETLSMNFPTVVFWDLNRVHTLASVQPYLDDLRRLKILHDTPESAAEFVNGIYEDPLLWWMSSELQQVKDKFCQEFARTSKNWLEEWRDEIIEVVSGAAALK